MNPTDINTKSIYQDIQQQENAVKNFMLREKLRSDLLQADPAPQGPRAQVKFWKRALQQRQRQEVLEEEKGSGFFLF